MSLLGYPLRRLGQLALKQGDYERATALCIESLRSNLVVGDKRGTAACLSAVAAVDQAQHRSIAAAKLYGAAEGLLNVLSAPLLPFDGAEYTRNVAELRASSNEAEVASGWAEGRAMSLDQAVAYALKAAPE